MKLLVSPLVVLFSVIANAQNLEKIVVSTQHPIYSCVFMRPGMFSDKPPYTFQLDQSKEALDSWQRAQDQIEQVLIFFEVDHVRSAETGICYPPSVSNSERELYHSKSNDIEWLKDNGIYAGN